MPGRQSAMLASDQRAVEYLQSLSVDEVRSIVRLMDQQMNITEPSFVTDEDMENYRADMIQDIQNGPLTGGGAGIMQSFPRSLLQNARRTTPAPRPTPPPVGARRPAAASSLDYGRFEDIDTDEESEGSESVFDIDRYQRNLPSGWELDETSSVTEDQANEQALNFIRNLTLPEFREFFESESSEPGRPKSDAELERIRARMIHNMTVGRNGDQRDGTSSQQTRRPPLPEDELYSVFFEEDDTIFRQKVKHMLRASPIPPRFVTADEIRLQARDLVADIFDDFDELKAILDRHECTIQKRWAKKTKNQRLKVLLTAWPEMPVRHRPDLHTVRASSRGEKLVNYHERDRDAYMWPNINQEDLLKPRVLPIFLHARGRHEPWKFWEFDIESVNLAAGLFLLDEPCLNRHHMCFRGRHDRETYGELVQFHSKEQATEAMKERSLPVGGGMTVLTIQQRILRFLIQCCREILHDIPSTSLLGFPVVADFSPLKASANAVTSLAEMTLETTYSLPNGIDIPGLKAIFSAKRSAAEDHVWALREDPSYFLDRLKDAMDHRYENVKDEHGQTHPNMRHGRESLIWGSVVSNMVAAAEYYLEAWGQLCNIIADIEKNVADLGGEMPTHNLPDDLRFNLSFLKVSLEYCMLGPLAQLKADFYSSAPMRQYVERLVEDTPKARKTGICDLSLKANASVSRMLQNSGGPESQLLWLIQNLMTDRKHEPVAAKQWGINCVIDELGRLTQDEMGAKALITSHIAEVISDLGIVAEAYRQLIGYAGQLYATPERPLKDKKGNVIKNSVPWHNMLDMIEGSNPQDFYTLCVPPNDGRFYYPSEKRRNRENHEAMRSAESNLDAFWRKVDANMEIQRQWHLEHLKTCDKCCDCGVDSGMKKLLTQPRYIQRLGEWVEHNASNEEQQRRADEAARKPLSEVYFDLERRTERTLAKPHKHKHNHAHNHHHDHEHHHGSGHNKIKTRGIPAHDKENVPPAVTPPSEQQDEQPIFEVDARAHKVFKTIFYNPSISSTPGEVPWLDFVHAMTATGFRAEKLYGSVWQFKPTRLDVERAIQIHEPHPSGKIPYRTCRNHGRRLNRAYGWIGEQFVLAGKPAA